MRFLRFLAVTVFCLWGQAALAQLQIEITQGVDNPTPIAIVPFAWDGLGMAPDDVGLIIDSDLVRSGQFAPVSRRDMLAFPTALPTFTLGIGVRSTPTMYSLVVWRS